MLISLRIFKPVIFTSSLSVFVLVLVYLCFLCLCMLLVCPLFFSFCSPQISGLFLLLYSYFFLNWIHFCLSCCCQPFCYQPFSPALKSGFGNKAYLWFYSLPASLQPLTEVYTKGCIKCTVTTHSHCCM